MNALQSFFFAIDHINIAHLAAIKYNELIKLVEGKLETLPEAQIYLLQLPNVIATL